MYGDYGYAATFDRSQQDQAMLDDIAKAIDGEYTAIACYGQLAKLAPDQAARDRILEIRQDEIRHFRQFTDLYYRLSGRQPTPKIAEPCSAEYASGIRNAFEDEQNTVDFYMGIADKTDFPSVREAFRRAAADEQNHAVWFLYFMTRK